MIRLLFAWLLTLFAFAMGTHTVNAATNCSPLLSQTFPRLQDEAPQSLCQYQGKVILVVNTASYCALLANMMALKRFMPNIKIKDW